MATNQKDNVLLRYYDKIVAVVVLLGLLGLLFILLSRIDQNKKDGVDKIRNRPEPNKPAEVISMEPYNAAMRSLQKPMRLEPPSIQDPGCYIPERRVQCVNKDCRKPIPLDAEKCVFCGVEQPKAAPVQEILDADEDGMPDKWEVKYGLNPQNADDAKEDMDGDGFTNLEEFVAGTDPRDPKSHPDLVTLLRVSDVHGKRMPFIFGSKNKMPDGYQLVFNLIKAKFGQSAIYAKTNSVIYASKGGYEAAKIGEAKPEDPKEAYQVVKFTDSSEKRDTGKGYKETVDTSVVVLRRLSDKRDIPLTIGAKKPVITDTEAVLAFPLDKKEWSLIEGGDFKVREETYRVISIESAKKEVLIENQETKKRSLIRPAE